MENEISSGTKLGIVLIALAAIIGLGFGVFSIAKGTANEGVTSVQENLNAVGDSAFSDYDQRIVTGSQVLSAYRNFAGKNYCILIATQAIKDSVNGDTDSSHIDPTAAGIAAAYGASWNPPAVISFGYENDAINDTVKTTKKSDGTTDVALMFVNYNALLTDAKAGKVGQNATATKASIGFDSTCYRATNGFRTTNGAVEFNNTSVNLSKSGMAEYIPTGARFQSYLVKDASGTIMGIAFEQIKS